MDQWSLTGLGMGTVFLALIFLALLVALFPLFFRKPEKKVKDLAPLPTFSSQTPAPAGALGTELVAVIAAAVAAASGSAPGSFRIASIVPSESSGGFNTPVWGHADRLCRPANHR